MMDREPDSASGPRREGSADSGAASSRSADATADELMGLRRVRTPVGDRIPIEGFQKLEPHLLFAPTGSLNEREAATTQQPVGIRPKPPTRMRSGPLSRFVLGLVAIGIIGGIFFAVRVGPTVRAQVPVLIAKTNLPAYHKLTSGDVTLGIRPANRKLGYARLPIIGRLTLRPIKKNDPIFSTDLTSNLARSLGTNLAVVGLSVSRAAVLGGTLSSGARIGIILAARHRHLAKFRAVVLSVNTDAIRRDNWVLIVALKTKDAREYGRFFADTDVIVLVNP